MPKIKKPEAKRRRKLSNLEGTLLKTALLRMAIIEGINKLPYRQSERIVALRKIRRLLKANKWLDDTTPDRENLRHITDRLTTRSDR